jgi:hypothetical protein
MLVQVVSECVIVVVVAAVLVSKSWLTRSFEIQMIPLTFHVKKASPISDREENKTKQNNKSESHSIHLYQPPRTLQKHQNPAPTGTQKPAADPPPDLPRDRTPSHRNTA